MLPQTTDSCSESSQNLRIRRSATLSTAQTHSSLSKPRNKRQVVKMRKNEKESIKAQTYKQHPIAPSMKATIFKKHFSAIRPRKVKPIEQNTQNMEFDDKTKHQVHMPSITMNQQEIQHLEQEECHHQSRLLNILMDDSIQGILFRRFNGLPQNLTLMSSKIKLLDCLRLIISSNLKAMKDRIAKGRNSEDFDNYKEMCPDLTKQLEIVVTEQIRELSELRESRLQLLARHTPKE